MSEKETRTVGFGLDEERLFENSIDDVISYLKELKAKFADKGQLVIKDVWTGYEDVHYELQYNELESDEEYATRREIEEEDRREYEKEQARLKHNKDIHDRMDSLRKQIK